MASSYNGARARPCARYARRRDLPSRYGARSPLEGCKAASAARRVFFLGRSLSGLTCVRCGRSLGAWSRQKRLRLAFLCVAKPEFFPATPHRQYYCGGIMARSFRTPLAWQHSPEAAKKIRERSKRLINESLALKAVADEMLARHKRERDARLPGGNPIS